MAALSLSELSALRQSAAVILARQAALRTIQEQDQTRRKGEARDAIASHANAPGE
jgi:hypothetical protein